MAISEFSRRLPKLTFVMFAASVAVIGISMFFGLLAVTANPVLIGLGIGLVLGPILLALPELTVWIILVIGLLMGVLSANPQFSKVTWIVSILSMLLLIPSLINLLWSNQRRAPAYMLIALAFMAYAVIVSLVQWYSLGEFVAGFKRYFQMFGLMLALTLIPFALKSFARWWQFLVVVAILQLPFAVYELLILVPQRGGLVLSSFTTDVVAGTFGANVRGGSPNSVMVTFLLVAIAFLIARWKAGAVNQKHFFLLFLVFLLPLGMGETKITLIMLPLVSFILLRKELFHAPLRYFPAFLAILLLTMLLGYVYVAVMMQSNPADVIKSAIEYNIGSRGYSDSQYLNRWTSLTFWLAEQGLNDPVSFLFGNGLGSSYTSTGALAGHLGLRHLNYGINLTAASTLLWETGVIGMMLFIAIFIAAWKCAGRLYQASSDPLVQADAQAIQAAIALFLLMLFYSDSVVNLVSMELIYALALGYLGFLSQRLFDGDQGKSGRG